MRLRLSRYAPRSLVLLFSAITVLQAQLIVTTAAGGAIRSGVPAENVQLNGTAGITHDPAGNLVFCERFVIRRLNPDGTIQTIAGTGFSGFSGDGGPATKAQLHYAASPQYDSKGNLYFIDGPRIRRIDPEGVITTFAGTGIYGTLGADGRLTNAQVSAGSLVIAPDDSIYIAEQNDIRRITTAGMIKTVASSSTCNNGAPITPSDVPCNPSLALDSKGNLYFVDGYLDSVFGLSFIYRLSPDGTITQFAGFGNPTSSSNGDGGPAMKAVFHGISAIAFDASDNLYVADTVDVSQVVGFIMAAPLIKTVSVIRRIAASDGTVSTIAGQATAPSPFEGPALQSYVGIVWGLAPNSDGSLSFSSTNTVGTLTTQSTVQLLVGRTPQPAPDGVPAAGGSWLSLPISVQMAPSRSGNFYYSDHCMIRKVGPDGILQTAAGTGNCASSVPKTFGPGIDLPPIYGLAVDSKDHIFVAFGTNLYSLHSDGTISAIAGVQNRAQALAFDSQDRLYVVGEFAVSRVNPDGTIELVRWNPVVVGAGLLACCSRGCHRWLRQRLPDELLSVQFELHSSCLPLHARWHLFHGGCI